MKELQNKITYQACIITYIAILEKSFSEITKRNLWFMKSIYSLPIIDTFSVPTYYNLLYCKLMCFLPLWLIRGDFYLWVSTKFYVIYKKKERFFRDENLFWEDTFIYNTYNYINLIYNFITFFKIILTVLK